MRATDYIDSVVARQRGSAIPKAETVLVIVGLGVGAYVLYKAYQEIKAAAGAVGGAISSAAQAAQTATQYVTNPTAYVTATAGPNVQAGGGVVFPDGTVMSIQQATSTYGGQLTANAQGTGAQLLYGGVLYDLGPRNAQNNWPLTPATSNLAPPPLVTAPASDSLTGSSYWDAIAQGAAQGF